jgi:hypothetical protein
MLAALIAIIAAIQALAFVVATVWFVVGVIRSQPVTPEEEERAFMRSLSWPSEAAKYETGCGSDPAIFQNPNS